MELVRGDLGQDGEPLLLDLGRRLVLGEGPCREVRSDQQGYQHDQHDDDHAHRVPPTARLAVSVCGHGRLPVSMTCSWPDPLSDTSRVPPRSRPSSRGFWPDDGITPSTAPEPPCSAAWVLTSVRGEA